MICFLGTMCMQAVCNSQVMGHNCIALRWILQDASLVRWKKINLRPTGIRVHKKTGQEGCSREGGVTSKYMALDKESRQLLIFCTPDARSVRAFQTKTLDLSRSYSFEQYISFKRISIILFCIFAQSMAARDSIAPYANNSCKNQCTYIHFASEWDQNTDAPLLTLTKQNLIPALILSQSTSLSREAGTP